MCNCLTKPCCDLQGALSNVLRGAGGALVLVMCKSSSHSLQCPTQHGMMRCSMLFVCMFAHHLSACAHTETTMYNVKGFPLTWCYYAAADDELKIIIDANL